MFVLDPAFPRSSDALTALRLCEVRVQLDARFPWLVLIPRLAGLTELDDLNLETRALFFEEIIQAGAAVRAMGVAAGRPVEKLNIGLLGNITPQLHAHVVGRRADDAAWPDPVWGQGEPIPYKPDVAKRLASVALTVLQPS